MESFDADRGGVIIDHPEILTGKFYKIRIHNLAHGNIPCIGFKLSFFFIHPGPYPFLIPEKEMIIDYDQALQWSRSRSGYLFQFLTLQVTGKEGLSVINEPYFIIMGEQ